MRTKRHPNLPFLIPLVGLVAVSVLIAVVAHQSLRRNQAARDAQRRAGSQTGLGSAEPGRPSDRSSAHRARAVSSNAGLHGETGFAPDDAAGGETEICCPDTGYSISGEVVDEQGAPVEGARVLVCLDYVSELGRCPVVRRVLADDAGRFEIEDLPAEDLYFAAKKGNLCSYLPGLRRYRWLAEFYPVPYVEGRSVAPNVKLVLRRGGVIAGTVLDAEGNPVSAATATIQGVLDSQLEVPADDAGRFRAEGLVPGDYRVGARADGFAAVWTAASIETDRENLAIHLPRGQRVEGAVIREDTLEPVPGATVTARPESYQQSVAGEQVFVYPETVETDERGAFVVSVCAGVGMHFGAGYEEYVTDEEQVVVVEAGAPVPRVTLKLVPGAAVSGTVLDHATEAPLADVRVVASWVYRKTSWSFTDTEGRFRLAGLVPGENYLWADPSEYELAGVPRGTYRIDIEVRGGEELTGLEIRVRRKETVSGRVENKDGQPVFGAIVLVKEAELDPASPDEGIGERCVTDPEGRFAAQRRRSDATITAILVCHPEYAHKLVEFGPDAWAGGEEKEIVVVLQKGGGCIEGIVGDEQGRPINRAAVYLQDLTTFTPHDTRQSVCLASAETDNRGHYAFPGVRAGTYEVEAQFGTQATRSGPVEVAQDAKVPDVNLTVCLPGHIQGRVVEAGGSPLAGFVVQCVRVRDWQWLPTAVTDQDGVYGFDELVKGEEYQVEVRIGEGRMYAGPDRRSIVCPADGQDFVLKRLETGTVRGIVYHESDGSPVTKYQVTLASVRERARVSQNVASEDGAFTCENVAAGMTRMVVTLPGSGMLRIESEPFEVVAGEETTQVVYVSDPGTIRGTVCRAGDRSPVTTFRLSLMPVDDRGRPSYAQWQFRAKLYESEAGSFICEGVMPGRYRLGILAEGLPDFESEPLKVTAGEETIQDLVIGEGAIVRGRVVDESGAPVPDAVVEESYPVRDRRQRMGIWQERTRLEQPRDTTDSSGEFTLRHVTPGDLVVLRVTHPDYATTEVRTEVRVQGEAPEKLTIRLERGTLLTGTVKGLGGEPLGGIDVNLGGRSIPGAKTDHRGRYRFEHVPRGTYTIRLNYLNVSFPKFALDGEEEKTVDIDLSEAGSVSGTLVLPSDAGTAWFRLTLSGLDHLEGCNRYARPGEDLSFELLGLLPGKYRVRIEGYRNDGNNTKHLAIVTTPSELTVEVGPKEQLKTTIEIQQISEPPR